MRMPGYASILRDAHNRMRNYDDLRLTDIMQTLDYRKG